MVKQLQLKSNLHRPNFYGDNPGKGPGDSIGTESHEVYEFDVNKLPASTFDADLAKMVSG